IRVDNLAFSPDGKLLAVIAEGEYAYLPGGITIWDTATGAVRARISLPPQAALRLAFSADGKRLAWMNGDGIIVVHNLSTGVNAQPIRLPHTADAVYVDAATGIIAAPTGSGQMAYARFWWPDQNGTWLDHTGSNNPQWETGRLSLSRDSRHLALATGP